MAKNLPEFVGTYKAMILGNIVEPSNKAKIPTLKLQVYLLEYFDVKEEEWINVEEEHWTMTTFLTLFSKDDEETLNHQQACKVFDWDGCGFGALCSPDIEGMTIQVRIKENENEKFPMEITWIDTEDADPKGGFKKATAEDIANLDEQFKHLLRKKKSKAASAKKGKTAATETKAKAKATPKPDPEPEGEEESEQEEVETPAEMSPAEKKKALLAKSKRLRKKQEDDRAKAAAAGPPKKAAGKKKTKGRVIEPGEDMPDDFDKQDAWYTVTAYRDEAADDDMQAAEWENAIAEIAEDGDEDKLDAEGWWAVKEQVLSNIGKD